MRRKEKALCDRVQIEAVIRSSGVCRVAMVDENRPYVVPMCFGYEPGRIYLHSAKTGRKIDVFKKNPHVCVLFDTDWTLVRNEKACSFTMHYASAMAFGKIGFIEDAPLKRHALGLLMAHYAQGPFDFPDEALLSMHILRVDIEKMTGKRSGGRALP